MIDITTTFAYGEVLPLTTILPSLVIIVQRSVDIWTKLLKKTVNWRPETCLQFKDGFRQLVVERNYRKTQFTLRIQTPNAWNALICLMRF